MSQMISVAIYLSVRLITYAQRSMYTSMYPPHTTCSYNLIFNSRCFYTPNFFLVTFLLLTEAVIYFVSHEVNELISYFYTL